MLSEGAVLSTVFHKFINDIVFEICSNILKFADDTAFL